MEPIKGLPRLPAPAAPGTAFRASGIQEIEENYGCKSHNLIHPSLFMSQPKMEVIIWSNAAL